TSAPAAYRRRFPSPEADVQSARGMVKTTGFALAVAGMPPLAVSLGWLALPSEDLPVPLWALGLGGAALVLAVASLLGPDSLTRPRGLLASLAISALALVFDGIAFGGPGRGWGLLLENLLDSLAMKQNAAMNVVVLFAVLLTLLSLFAWLQWLRGFAEKA